MPELDSRQSKQRDSLGKLLRSELLSSLGRTYRREELSKQKAFHRGRFLDVGTGPATQAVQIARNGYLVTGSDISQAAIHRAREIYGSEPNVSFVVDNILHTNSRRMNTITSLIVVVFMFYILQTG